MFQEVKRASAARVEGDLSPGALVIALHHKDFIRTTFCGIVVRSCVSGRHGQEREQLRIAAAEWWWETCLGSEGLRLLSRWRNDSRVRANQTDRQGCISDRVCASGAGATMVGAYCGLPPTSTSASAFFRSQYRT